MAIPYQSLQDHQSNPENHPIKQHFLIKSTTESKTEFPITEELQPTENKVPVFERIYPFL